MVFSKDLYNWSVHYVNTKQNNYVETHTLTEVGKFLKRNKTPIEVKNNETYKRVTIRINGGGISTRDTLQGADIGTKNQFKIEKGQFLLSKIDARNGAFGVVPDECDGAIITGNFWTFDVDYEQVNPTYLMMFMATKHFQYISQSASTGTTNRNYLQEDLFLQMQIPLPALPIQNQLVSDYQARLQQASEAEQQASQLEKGIESYLLDALGITFETKISKEQNSPYKFLQFVELKDVSRWGVEFLTKGALQPLQSQKYAMELLENVVWVNPKISYASLKPEDEITFIPMETISDEFGELMEHRKTTVAQSKGYTKIEEGDLIWAKITPCMENGKSAIVKDLKNGFACGSTEFHVFRAKNDSIELTFLYTLFRSVYLRNIAKKHFAGSAGQQRVPSQFFKDLEIPLPPLPTQNEIVAHITTQKNEIKRLRAEAQRLREEAKHNFEQEIFN